MQGLFLNYNIINYDIYVCFNLWFYVLFDYIILKLYMIKMLKNFEIMIKMLKKFLNKCMCLK